MVIIKKVVFLEGENRGGGLEFRLGLVSIIFFNFYYDNKEGWYLRSVFFVIGNFY